MDYNEIVQEWFAKLPMGYALAPYSSEELSVLHEVLRSHGIIAEEEEEVTEPPPPIDANPNSEEKDPVERFHAKSAKFMQSAGNFEEFILEKYTQNVELVGLSNLYKAIATSDEDVFQNVGKIIGKGTNRTTDGGTFELGKYEMLLKRLVNKYVRVSSGESNQLFLAMLYDGKVVVNQGMDDITVGVLIPGNKGLMLQTSDIAKYIDFGNLPENTADILSKLLELYKIVNEESTGVTFTPDELTSLLKELVSPQAAEEFDTMIKMSQTSQVGAFQKLSKRVANIVGDSDVRSLVYEFIQGLNSYMKMKLSTFSYWVAIPKDSNMVYIERAGDIYKMLQSTIDPIRVNKLIATITESNVRVRGDVLVKKIVK